MARKPCRVVPYLVLHTPQRLAAAQDTAVVLDKIIPASTARMLLFCPAWHRSRAQCWVFP